MIKKKKIAYLHNHTVYSEKDSLATIDEYADKVKKINESTDVDVVGFAVTEHSNMFSYTKAYTKLEGITKPIVGCEVYHCIDRKTASNDDRFHLVLLAKDDVGLKNLYRITSDAGMHQISTRYKSYNRTHLDTLAKYGKGIVALSACVGGIIPKLILDGNYALAKDYALYFKQIFSDFYLEVQPHNFDLQSKVNPEIVRMSKETGIELVITTDSHYVDKEDKVHHDLLKKVMNLSGFSCSAHLYSYDELYNYCVNNNIPLSAIENTVKIAEMCTANPKPKTQTGLLPEFKTPVGYTPETYLRKIAFECLFEKAKINKFVDMTVRINRLNYELDVICSRGFSSYFLILWDWFKYCSDNDILLGPGRGSGAGSLVSYVLSITTVDPIKNGFIFERFLNLERVEFPDIDSDVAKDKRSMAIQYLLNKYGNEHIAQIVTFSKLKVKNTFKTAMSALVPDSFEIANKISKMIPVKLGEEMNVSYSLLKDVYENPGNYPELSSSELGQVKRSMQALEEVFQKYPEVYQAVGKLHGAVSGIGLHAGGVVISSKPLHENIPIMKGSDTAVLPVLQQEMDDLDFHKALKIDVLGLCYLQQVHLAMKLIGLEKEWFYNEDFSDTAVYEMFRKGETTDIFQMSSFSATKLIQDMNVVDFEGLGVVNSGNRPGPQAKDKVTNKSMVDLYIERERSNQIPSIDPRIDAILKETNACLW